MHVRLKTKRRMILAAVMFTVMLVFGVGGAVIRHHQRHQQLERDHQEGLRAAKEGRHLEAVRRLDHYLQAFPSDTKALMAFAQSRLRVPVPVDAHVADARRSLKRLIEIEPDHIDGRMLLLMLLIRVDDQTEIERVAAAGLERTPDHLVLRRIYAEILTRQRQYDLAQKVIDRGLALAPGDLSLYALELTLMSRRKLQDDAIKAKALSWVEAHPDDPRFQLLAGYAHLLAHDSEGGRQWLLKTVDAKIQIEEPDFMRRLIDLMAAAGLGQEATDLLVHRVAQGGAVWMTDMLLPRLLRADRYSDMIDLATRWQSGRRSLADESLALITLALSVSGRRKRPRSGWQTLSSAR